MANHHHVERVALAHAAAVGCAPRHRREPPAEFRIITRDCFRRRFRHAELFAVVVNPQAGDRYRKRELLHAGGSEQLDGELLRALVEGRKNKPLHRCARPDHAPAEALPLEECVHAPVGPAGDPQFERQEKQQMREHEREQPEFQQPPANAEVIGVRRLQRRIVARVDARQTKPPGVRTVIRDFQPERLDPLAGQRHPEKPVAFAVIENRGLNCDVVVLEDHHPVEERPMLRPGRVRNAEPEGFPTAFDAHGGPAG